MYFYHASKFWRLIFKANNPPAFQAHCPRIPERKVQDVQTCLQIEEATSVQSQSNRKNINRELLLEWMGFGASNHHDLDLAKPVLEINNPRLAALAFVTTMVQCKTKHFTKLLAILDREACPEQQRQRKSEFQKYLCRLEDLCLQTALVKLPLVDRDLDSQGLPGLATNSIFFCFLFVKKSLIGP